MPASYPGSIKTYAANTDDVTLVNAAYMDQRDQEITAIETDLVTRPKGSTVSVPFTDGDTLRRVTVTNAAVLATSAIVVTVRRPDTADDSADRGYLYVANVVRVAAGAFDVLIACLGWGFDDPVLNPPGETIVLNYTIQN